MYEAQVVDDNFDPGSFIGSAGQPGRAGRPGDSHLFGDPMRKSFRLCQSRHFGDPDAVREVVEGLGSCLEREARLP